MGIYDFYGDYDARISLFYFYNLTTTTVVRCVSAHIVVVFIFDISPLFTHSYDPSLSPTLKNNKRGTSLHYSTAAAETVAVILCLMLLAADAQTSAHYF